MADTDSALKTQLFMSESQRNNAMDLTNRINQGFQAIGQALKFKSDISQSMVSSALDLRKLEIDEWYKGEALKNEAASLRIREQELIKDNDYRRDALNEKMEYNRLERERKLADQDRIRANSLVTNQIGVLDQENEGLVIEAANIEKRINQLEVDYFANPGKTSREEIDDLKANYRLGLEKIQGKIISNKFKVSRLTNTKGDIAAGLADLSTVSGAPNERDYSGLRNAPNESANIGLTPNPKIIDGVDRGPSVVTDEYGVMSLGESKGKYYPSPQGLPLSQEYPVDQLTGQMLSPEQVEIALKQGGTLVPEHQRNAYNNQQQKSKSSDVDSGLTEKRGFDKEVIPIVKPKTYKISAKDVFYYADTAPNADYNPAALKNMYESLPEEERNNVSSKIKISRAEEAAKSAVALIWEANYEPKKENERYGDIIPTDNFKTINVFQETKKAALERLKNKTSDDLIKDPSLITLEDGMKAANKVFGINQEPNTPPAAPRPPGVNTDEVNAALGLGGKNPQPNNPPPNTDEFNIETATNNYIKMLGGDSLESDAMGSSFNEEINKKASALAEFEKNTIQFLQKNERELTRSLASLSEDELGVIRTVASGDYGSSTYGTYVNREQAVKAIMAKGKEYAAEFLAENELSKNKKLGIYRKARKELEPKKSAIERSREKLRKTREYLQTTLEQQPNVNVYK